MPDLIRHPVPFWIPAFAGMTTVGYLTTGVITCFVLCILEAIYNSFLVSLYTGSSGSSTLEPLDPRTL